jgi:DNA-binding transcriptional regulator YdaS (Cro superfamily)
MMRKKTPLERAIEIAGSQAALAASIGKSQQAISYAKKRSLRVTAEMAVSIEKATKGAVRKEELRPDIFA